MSADNESSAMGGPRAEGGTGAVTEGRAAALRVEGVTAGYGVVSVLRDLSLHVDPGEIVAVLGTNGAGKSTLLKTIVGLLRPTAGQVLLGDEDVSRTPPESMASKGVVLVPEGRQLFGEMTVRENLILGAYSRRRRQRESREQDLERVVELFSVLGERMRSRAANLSGGQQQMLAIGRGMMAHPSILLLDEPSLGLAPIVTREVFETFEILRGGGITVMLVEQQAMLTLKLSDRAYVLERGRIVVEGTSQEVIDEDQVRSAYLGLNVTAAGAQGDSAGEYQAG
jgi:branched-chain amino acid transport system ATP-binding protein